MKQFLVYKCVNCVNNKIYIGCTKRSLKKRLCEHIRDATYNNPRYGKRHFYNAIRKYGGDAFTIELLEECVSFNAMLDAEAKWIKDLDTLNDEIGYNSTSGGRQAEMTEDVKKKISENNGRYWAGKHLSEETIEKIRTAHTGKILTEEHKHKIGAAQTGDKHWTYGKPRPEETREKIRQANTGKHPSEEAKQKMSLARAGKPKFYKNKLSTSKYFGVTVRKGQKPWMARITLPDGTRKYLGTYGTDEEAALAYDEFIKENNIQAPLNFS